MAALAVDLRATKVATTLSRKAAGGQPVSAGNIQDLLPGPGSQQGDEGGPAQNIQDVNKKPYTSPLTSPRNLAMIK